GSRPLRSVGGRYRDRRGADAGRQQPGRVRRRPSEEEMMRRERARLSGVRGITSYAWSPDGRSILVPLDGDLYLAGLDGNVRRITDTPQTELDAQVSRTGRYLSFARDRNLHVVDADGRNDRALTSDGGGTVSWGSAEFVA